MRKKHILIVLLACCLVAAVLVLALKWTPRSTVSPMTCTFLKVGKADAMVVQSGGQTMVIDTGEEDDGQELVDFLRKKNVAMIDILIITHYDKDHVGGADTLISELPVVRVLLPAYQGSNTEYTDFMSALKNARIEPEYVEETLAFPLGEAVVTVEPPNSWDIPEGAVEYDNNLSLLTTVTHGTNRLCFAGDIEKERIRELISDGTLQECVFLKMPHHGIYNTASEDLIKALHPRYAVVCSSDKHPAETALLELAKKYGVDVLETRFGNITLISDGQHVDLHQKVRH